VLVVVRVYFGENILFGFDPVRGKVVCHLGNLATLGSLTLCVVIASDFIYLAAFACFFLLIAGVAKALQRRHGYPLVTAGLLIAAVAAGGLVNALPNLLFQWRHGHNAGAVIRYRDQADN